MDTLSAMNDATHAMSENGSLHVNDLPGFFRERCTSLPAFVAAFTKRKSLSAKELDELQDMIDRIRKGDTR